MRLPAAPAGRARRLARLLVASAVLASCHERGPGVTDPPPVPTYSVTATVFYDENGNGLLDPAESVRVPGVEVVIGTGVGKSGSNGGQAVVSGIEEGVVQVGVRIGSVPEYFQPAVAATVQVPGGPTEVRVPLTLAIGRNQPNVYVGQVLAQAWFKAITRARATASPSHRFGFGAR